MKKWLLILALHSAHTFDAYSTNRFVRLQTGHEVNPIYKPFAGRKTMYVGENVQAGLEELGARWLRKHHHPKLAKVLIGESLVTETGLGIHNLTLKK